MNNFIRDYLVKLYIPRITWTDIIEIVIIAFVIYNVMVWIKNTKAWVLLKGIIIVVIFALIAYILNLKTILCTCYYIPAGVKKSIRAAWTKEDSVWTFQV